MPVINTPVPPAALMSALKESRNAEIAPDVLRQNTLQRFIFDAAEQQFRMTL
jgi:hypothetical protein